MALREGLSPVGAEVLQEELRAAALRCSGMAPPAAAGEGQGDGDAVDRPQDAGQPAASASQQQQQSAALVTPAFSSSVAATAALGLSPEGLSLFQQQVRGGDGGHLHGKMGLGKAGRVLERSAAPTFATPTAPPSTNAGSSAGGGGWHLPRSLPHRSDWAGAGAGGRTSAGAGRGGCRGGWAASAGQGRFVRRASSVCGSKLSCAACLPASLLCSAAYPCSDM